MSFDFAKHNLLALEFLHILMTTIIKINIKIWHEYLNL